MWPHAIGLVSRGPTHRATPRRPRQGINIVAASGRQTQLQNLYPGTFYVGVCVLNQSIVRTLEVWDVNGWVMVVH